MSNIQRIHRSQNAFLITIELPGVKREDIDLTIQGSRMFVKAKRKRPEANPLHLETSGQFYQTSFPLGRDIDEDSIEARLENGVLYLELRKNERKHTIPIKAA